jgi:hypothetical protein
MPEVINYRRNRLKKILEKAGFKWRLQGQPLSADKLRQLGMSRHRMKDLLDNRENRKALQPHEATLISDWLGLDELQLWEDSPTPVELVSIKFHLNGDR